MAQPNDYLADEALVRQALAGDAASFSSIVDKYYPMVFSVGLSWLHHYETAEELAQEVFLRAYLNLSKLKSPRFVSLWLSQIARNLANDWLRRRKHHSEIVNMIPIDEVPGEIPAMNTPSARTQLESRQEEDLLKQAVFRLSPKIREVVLLHYAEGLSKSEIARRINAHPASVGRYLERAMEDLRKDLAPALAEKSLLSLRSRASGAARASLVIAAAAAMTPSAKAAVFAAAANTCSFGVFEIARAAATSLLGNAVPTLAGTALGAKTGIVVAGALAIGLLYAAHRVSEHRDKAGAAPAPVDAASSAREPRFGRRRDGAPTRSDTAAAPLSSRAKPSSPASPRTDSTTRPVEADDDASSESLAPIPVSMRVQWEDASPAASVKMTCLPRVSATTRTRTAEPAAVTGITDHQGRASAEVPGNTHTVRITAESDDAVRLEKEYRVVPGTPIVVTLSPGLTVFGTVYVSENDKRIPAAGATVSAAYNGAPRTTSGASGTYKLTGISKKDVELFASLGAMRAPADRNERHVLHLSAGAPNGPHDLVLMPAATLSGAVIDKATGAPIPGAHVSAFADHNRQNQIEFDFTFANEDFHAVTDEKGLFRIDGLPQGPQRVRALAKDHGDLVTWVKLATGEENSVVLELDRGGTIDTTVVDQNGEPVEIAAISVVRRDGWFIAGRTDDNGRFTLQGAAWGVTHELWAWKYSTPTVHEKVTLMEGEAGTSVTLRFRFNKAEADRGCQLIVGSVRSESGLPIQKVALYIQQDWAIERDYLGDVTIPDVQGEFRMERKRARGPFYLSVSGKGWAPAWAMAQYGTEDKPERVNFVLKKGHWLEGVVVDDKGAPIPAATVRPYPTEGPFATDGHPGMREVTADASGRFRLENLCGPKVRVTAAKTGWTMPGNQITDIDRSVRLVMTPAGEITGCLLDATQKPVVVFTVKAEGRNVSSLLRTAGLQFFGEDGRFRLPDLVPGQDYRLTISSGMGRHGTLTRTINASMPGTGNAKEEILILPPVEPIASPAGSP